ncbi:MAG: hypothetical protein MJ107_01260 [Lachnospiraceae bacterium]|nr:hypothetical protein [Lachnospiraceae bacterium]
MIDINNVKEKLFDWSGKAMSKGKTAKDYIQLKAEINTCENVINRSYATLGRKYYEMYANGGFNPEFEKQMKDIANAKKAAKELEEKLEDMKNVK